MSAFCTTTATTAAVAAAANHQNFIPVLVESHVSN
jgi:hypothetical protein